MNVKKILLLFTLFIIVQTVAAEQYDLEFMMQDIAGKKIENVYVTSTFMNEATQEEITKFEYIKNGYISFQTAAPKNKIILQIDDLNTSGKDFYVMKEITATQSFKETITVLPVGSIRGTVVDELDNLVSNAPLKFECEKDYSIENPSATDKFGSFDALYLPVGNCVIKASFRDAVGNITVTIEQGKIGEVAIKLNKTILESKSQTTTIVVVIFSIAIIIVGGVLIKRRFPKTKKKQVKEPTLNKRVTDIMKTLNEREQKVVTFLLENKEQSTQAKIRFHTLIPKTSLARVFESLKNKNIITIEALGKLKKIKLTLWFLGKKP